MILVLSIAAQSQTGGNFTITQSVVASGGGQQIIGGAFSLDGTIGQPVAGTNPANGAFSTRSGFWQLSFAPTAAGVSVSGRILTADGIGVRNAIVSVTLANGEVLITRSSSFGYYRFDDLEAGQTIVVSVISKRFQFAPQVLTLNESIAELDFLEQ